MAVARAEGGRAVRWPFSWPREAVRVARARGGAARARLGGDDRVVFRDALPTETRPAGDHERAAPGGRGAGHSLRQLGRSWYVFFFQIPWLPEWVLRRNGAEAVGRAFSELAIDKSRFPAEVLKVYRDAALLPGAAKAMVDYYRALLRGGGGRRQRKLGYPAIETPTLVIWGEEDPALGIELTHATGEFVKDLTLRTLPGVSHWVQQEAPEVVNSMLEAWLTGEPVPEAPPRG